MPKNHVKPTKEELQAAADAALAEDERLAAEDAAGNHQETPEEKEAREAEEQRVSEEARVKAEEDEKARIAAEENEDHQETPEEKEAREAEEQAKAQKETDWKKRYTDSSREAKVLAVKNKEINQAVEEAATIEMPTDEEVKAEYPEWDEMTTTEQRFARESLLSKKRFELIHGATQKYQKVEKWNEKVDVFVEDPQTLIANPELELKTEEFKIFASKPSRVGLDFEDLVLAFLGEEAKKIKPNHKGEKMFETGGGGSNKTPIIPDNKLSIQQSEIDRKTNYPLYKERLRAGKYKTE